MMEFQHTSVLLHEAVEGLGIKPDGVYIDGTCGGAGHSAAIARHLNEKGRLIGLDQDPDAVGVARDRLSAYPCAQVVQSNFAQLDSVLDTLGIAQIDGLLLDLGVSSYQLDAGERGFSYRQDAPLDMRMSKSGLCAKDIVNTYPVSQLVQILREYAEERFAGRIAAAIVAAREEAEIQTTFELAAIVRRAIPAKAAREDTKNPCRRTFQALRIEVNDELGVLSRTLDTGFNRLATGGRFCVITFHSLEDRMVKQRFAAFATGCTCPSDFPVCICGKQPRGRLIVKKPITASPEECAANSRSRTAKLRIIEKL